MISETDTPDNAAPEISIIIPAYNEGEGIIRVLQSIQNQPSLAGAEIVVVDDGSTDNTGEVVANFPGVHLVSHRMNKGYGAAISTGVKASTGRYVIWFDADWQYRVEDLVHLAQVIVKKDLDWCVGARGSDSYQERERVFGKFLLGLAVRIVTMRKVPDYNSGLRGYKSEVIKRYLHLLPKGFGASTTMTLIMLERGYYGEDIPIIQRKRIGKSSVKIFRDGILTLMIILRIFLLFKPLRFFGSAGIIFILGGLIYGVPKAIQTRTGFPVMAALTIILGVQAFFFGLLADQISQSRLERFE
jgi:glycosyltransferase involved in cell wall biosynthesis